MRTTSKLGVAVAALAAAAGVAGAGGACAPDLSFITGLVNGYLASRPALDGATVIIRVGDEVLYERDFGSYTPATVIPIASASKWLSGATLMSVVDDGTVSLDTRVSDWIPSFKSGLLADITLRQCFSHSSGLPGDSALLNLPGLSLQEFADAAAAAGLRTDAQGEEVVPGTSFCYGGVSMQVAGAVVENATGETFESLLQSRIAGPLGMTSTVFPPGVEPRVAGGIRSNARDYARFLKMLLDGGVWNGQQVLTAESVAAMNSAQIGAVRVDCVPRSPTGWGRGWTSRRPAGSRWRTRRARAPSASTGGSCRIADCSACS
jgi:CubicO group peptidase (beta-lactamase class C family)